MDRVDLSTWRARAARRCAIVCGAVWVAVFLVASATGESFDSVSFAGRWQLVPIENLRADPFGSVWNLHVQPPLWNLLIGVIDRWSPLPFRFSLEALMVAFGFVAAVLLCDTLRHIGLRPRWAVLLTLFVLCAPDVLLNAYEPRYELMTTTGLIAMAWVIVRGSAATERTKWLVVLAVIATAVTMIRTVYHPLWLTGLLALFAWRWRGAVTRRGLATTALVPLVIVGGWMVKNEYLVGRFTFDDVVGDEPATHGHPPAACRRQAGHARQWRAERDQRGRTVPAVRRLRPTARALRTEVELARTQSAGPRSSLYRAELQQRVLPPRLRPRGRRRDGRDPSAP